VEKEILPTTRELGIGFAAYLPLGRGFLTSEVKPATEYAQGDDIVPIPGTRSPDRLAQNATAADVQLSAENLKRVDEALAGGSFGGRYPEAMMPQW